MSMLALLKAGQNPGEPTYLTPEEFQTKYTRTQGDQVINLQTECTWWAFNGRLGSRVVIHQSVYVLVKDENDDPFKYYQPEKPIYSVPNTWSQSHAGCCGGSRGGSTSDCSSGNCGSGGCSP